MPIDVVPKMSQTTSYVQSEQNKNRIRNQIEWMIQLNITRHTFWVFKKKQTLLPLFMDGDQLPQG